MNTITGTFSVKMTPEDPWDVDNGVTLGRLRFDKVFSGPLTATSIVQMMAVRTAVADPASYVAVEMIVGSVDGKAGSFVVTHTGHMTGGTQTLALAVVADSGTGELAGISGTMTIDIIEGQHHYTLHYALRA